MNRDDSKQYALWKLRRDAKITDREPRLCGLVVEAECSLDRVALSHSQQNGADRKCKCGYNLCSKLGPCAPPKMATCAECGLSDVASLKSCARCGEVKSNENITAKPIGGFSAGGQASEPSDPEQPNLVLNVNDIGMNRCYCNRCGWETSDWRTVGRMLAFYEIHHKCPTLRFMRQDILFHDWDCSDCAWRSGTHEQSKSDEAFSIHECVQWPKGTTGYGHTCVVCGASPLFPTMEGSTLWGMKHKDCKRDADRKRLLSKAPERHPTDHVEPNLDALAQLKPRPFKVGDRVRVMRNTTRGWEQFTCGVIGDTDKLYGYRVDVGGNSYFHPASDLEHVG